MQNSGFGVHSVSGCLSHSYLSEIPNIVIIVHAPSCTKDPLNGGTTYTTHVSGGTWKYYFKSTQDVELLCMNSD